VNGKIEADAVHCLKKPLKIERSESSRAGVLFSYLLQVVGL